MRRYIRPVAAALMAAIVACRDYPLDPNTDAGLRVWVEVSPRIVSVSDTTAILRIRLNVMNPSEREITVITGGPPYRSGGKPTRNSGLFGSIRIARGADSLNAGPNVDWFGQPVYTLRPRSRLYDELIVPLKEWQARGWQLAVGEYRARGWFNGREGTSATFVLKP